MSHHRKGRRLKLSVRVCPPALQSWIKNCLAPRMVEQYLAERKIKTEVALEDKSVRDSTETTRKRWSAMSNE